MDKTKHRHRGVAAAFAAAGGILLVDGGLAAAASAQGAALVMEEVVVTARKRGAESIQDIGGSIQVLEGDALTEQVSTGFADYMREVPGLSANSSGTGQAQLRTAAVGGQPDSNEALL